MTMAKIRKATDEEKGNYHGRYPLFGFIKCSGKECAVEDLRGSWSRPDPTYEVMAPKGFIFVPDGVHTLLADDLADVRSRVGANSLEAEEGGR
jgi:hypothetical protein